MPQKRVSHNFRYIRFPINVVEAKVKGSTKGTRLSLVRLKDFLMSFKESYIEQTLISKLEDLKYTYRPDIRDKAALEQNFRDKFQGAQ